MGGFRWSNSAALRVASRGTRKVIGFKRLLATLDRAAGFSEQRVARQADNNDVTRCRNFIAIVVLAGLVVIGACRTTAPAPTTRPVTTAPTPPAVRYLAMLQSRILYGCDQLPQLSLSADEAAKRVFSGGKLYVDGSQPDFAAELINRTGGLAMLDRVPDRVERGDVILYAARSKLTPNDLARISSWQSQGLYVIAFASQALSYNPYFEPNILIDSGPREGLVLADGKICPTDAVMNIVNAWAWTGEFFAACARRGRVPVMNQSFLTAGAYERASRYRGQAFHNDVKVPPIARGRLATEYLDTLSACVERLESSADSFAQAGLWVREATPRRSTLEIFSNVFPSNVRDSRTPQLFGTLSGDGAVWPVRNAVVVVAIGYQQPKQLLIDASHARRTKLVYSAVKRGEDDRSRSIIYINPCFAAADACVVARGYDIPILPPSSVVQSAIYWSIVAEAAGVAKQ